MLGVAATFFTKNFDALERRWRQEGGLLPRLPGTRVDNVLTMGSLETPPDIKLEGPRPNYRLLADDELGPASTADPTDAGCFVVFDWSRREQIWESQWGSLVYTPSGFCFDQQAMYVNDLEGSSVFVVDLVDQPGRLLRRISHPYFNDIHGLTRTRNGLLVASSGTDVVVELDLDGNLLREWWAAEYGYQDSPAGVRRVAGRGLEHRDRFYHTRMHATHLNQATFRDDEEQQLLVVLFQQGQIVQVECEAPIGTPPTILVDGLVRPHGLTRTPTGWLIASSAAAEILTFDHYFRPTGRLEIPGAGWLQDVAMLSTGRVLVNDTDRHQLTELAPDEGWSIVSTTAYHPSWRMDEVAEVPPHLMTAFP